MLFVMSSVKSDKILAEHDARLQALMGQSSVTMDGLTPIISLSSMSVIPVFY